MGIDAYDKASRLSAGELAGELHQAGELAGEERGGRMREMFHAARTETGARVYVAGKSLAPRRTWRNHSPTGFEWGYQGSGPAQLALAMLGHVFDKEFALEHYQCFKREILAGIEADEWYMTFDELRDWRKKHLGCILGNNETPTALYDLAAKKGKGKP